MRIAITLLLACLSATAQAVWGFGANAFTESSPKPSAFAFYATEIDHANEIFSVSEIDFIPVGLNPVRIQTSPRTGVAKHFRRFGTIDTFLLVDGGVATNGTNTSGAAGGGFAAHVPIKNSSWGAVLGYRAVTTAIGGTTHLIQIGFGRRSQ